MERLKSFVAAAVLTMPVLAMLSAALILDDVPSELRASPAAELASPRQITTDGDVDVRVVVQPTTPSHVRAPAWQGIVGDVYPSAGDTLVTGDLFALVGGRPVIAAATPSPFARTLARGTSGLDVRHLQELLTIIGAYEGELDGKFGASTAQAVKRWQQALQDPAAGETFDPASVVWLPSEKFIVAELGLTVGTPAPAAGAIIATAPVEAWSGALYRADSTERVTNIGEGVELVIQGQSLGAVKADGLTADQARRVSEMPDLERDEPAVAPSEQDDDLLTAGSAEPSANGQVAASGTLRTAPQTQWALPAGSLVTDASSGSTCIFVAAEAGQFEPFLASPTGGDLGLVFVDPAPAVDAAVLTNPLEILQDVSCE